MTHLKITLRRSSIGCTDRQKAVLKGLGLRRIGQTRLLENTPAVRGMVKRIIHLLDFEPAVTTEGNHGE